MNQINRGRLFLIPNIIHPDTENQVISPIIYSIVKSLDYYLVENIRTARRYLSALMKKLPESERIPIHTIQFEVLDKNTSPADLNEFLGPLKSGRDCGIISESGCPGIADPGSEGVKLAHKMKIEVVPLPGPSSIYLALMASGMNGQSFAFQGYLPVDKNELLNRIRKLEDLSAKLGQSQIFIETPYRNQRLFDSLIDTCRAQTNICVAMDITGPNQYIKTKQVSEWKHEKITFEKVPVVFLLSA